MMSFSQLRTTATQYFISLHNAARDNIPVIMPQLAPKDLAVYENPRDPSFLFVAAKVNGRDFGSYTYRDPNMAVIEPSQDVYFEIGPAAQNPDDVVSPKDPSDKFFQNAVFMVDPNTARALNINMHELDRCRLLRAMAYVNAVSATIPSSLVRSVISGDDLRVAGGMLMDAARIFMTHGWYDRGFDALSNSMVLYNSTMNAMFGIFMEMAQMMTPDQARHTKNILEAKGFGTEFIDTARQISAQAAAAKEPKV